MDRDLYQSLDRLIDEGNDDELQRLKARLERELDARSIGRGPVYAEVMKVVRKIDAELITRHLIRQRQTARR